MTKKELPSKSEIVKSNDEVRSAVRLINCRCIMALVAMYLSIHAKVIGELVP